MERGKSRESGRSAGTRVLMSAQLGFFKPGHPPHSKEIRDAGEIQEDPDAADIEEICRVSSRSLDGSTLRSNNLL